MTLGWLDSIGEDGYSLGSEIALSADLARILLRHTSSFGRNSSDSFQDFWKPSLRTSV